MRWPKQELLTVKLPKARKTKWSVTAKVYKGLLLLDCFYDTVKKGRYVIDQKGDMNSSRRNGRSVVLSMPQKDGMDGVLVQIKKGTVKSLLIFVSGMRKEQ